MRFIKVQKEERRGEVAINLDLVRKAHFGGGLLHLYFEQSSSSQNDMTFTGENTLYFFALPLPMRVCKDDVRGSITIQCSCADEGGVLCPLKLRSVRS